MIVNERNYRDYAYEDSKEGRQVQVTAPTGDRTHYVFHLDALKRGRLKQVSQGWSSTRYEYEVWNEYGAPFVYASKMRTVLPSWTLRETTFHYDVQDPCGKACYGNLVSTHSQVGGDDESFTTRRIYHAPLVSGTIVARPARFAHPHRLYL